MNVKNNKRKRESIKKIESVFIEFLQKKDIGQISVTDICKLTGLNRSTFYANYTDIYDLADKIKEKLEREFSALFSTENTINETDGALKMFRHIKENQLFYKTYFKLGYDESHQIYVWDTERAKKDFENTHIKYHIEFFKNGINAIIKMWLNDGCIESPEEMAEIIKSEYKGR